MVAPPALFVFGGLEVGDPKFVVEASELGWKPGHFLLDFDYRGRKWVFIEPMVVCRVQQGSISDEVVGWVYRARFGSEVDGSEGRPYFHVLSD